MCFSLRTARQQPLSVHRRRFPAAPGWLTPGSRPTFPAAPGWLIPGSPTARVCRAEPPTPRFPAAPGWLTPGSRPTFPAAPGWFTPGSRPTFPAAPGWLRPGSLWACRLGTKPASRDAMANVAIQHRMFAKPRCAFITRSSSLERLSCRRLARRFGFGSCGRSRPLLRRNNQRVQHSYEVTKLDLGVARRGLEREHRVGDRRIEFPAGEI